MNPLKPLLAFAAFLFAAAAPASQATAQAQSSAAAQRVRADVEFLSNDLLEGRDTGSRGHDIAAAYVASQFRAIGLQPGGTGGSWYQQVPFRRSSHEGPPAGALIIGNERVTLRPGTDFAVRPSLKVKERQVEAPLVFAGHGISDARLGIDEYAGIDARGKIVVVLYGAPPGLPSEIAAHVASWKAATAAEKGAVGLIEIPGTNFRGGTGSLAHYARPPTDWLDRSGNSSSASATLPLIGGISRDIAERLFKAAGRDLAQIATVGPQRKPVQGFDLPARLSISDTMAWHDFTSPNVIGVLPGSDPALKNQHVVLMGHLDHLGTRLDAKPGEDRVFNGAIDNAAGIATMLEAARSFAASGDPPRRSVLFIAVTGEEKGLRGADFYAANPTVPRDQLVGVVNLDMPMLLYPFTDVIAFGGERSTIAPTIAQSGAAMGVAVSPDPMPEQAIFVRSDHYPFVKQGIPAVLLMTGYANGGEAIWKNFFASAYHKPGDDLTQAILWEQGARYAELNYRIARALADADKRPMWYADDYFGETFAPESIRAPK